MKNIIIHFISCLIIITIYWNSTSDICWYIICDFYNFITHTYLFINNTLKILIIFTNTFAGIPVIIFFSFSIIFILTLACFITPILIWITCCTIKFAFTCTNIYTFCFTGKNIFADKSSKEWLFAEVIKSVATFTPYI